MAVAAIFDFEKSERPHRCCHLPNMVENIDRTPILYNGQGDSLFSRKLPFPWGGVGPIEYMVPCLTRVHIGRWHHDRFIRFSTAQSRYSCIDTTEFQLSADVLMRFIIERRPSLVSCLDLQFNYTAPIGERSIVMSVCVCVCVRDRVFRTTRPLFTKFFVHVTSGRGRGSVLLWLKRSAHAALGLAINYAQ